MAPITEGPLRIFLADFPDEDTTTTVASTTTEVVTQSSSLEAVKEVVIRESEETLMTIFVLALVGFLMFQFYRCFRKVVDPYAKVGDLGGTSGYSR